MCLLLIHPVVFWFSPKPFGFCPLMLRTSLGSDWMWHSKVATLGPNSQTEMPLNWLQDFKQLKNVTADSLHLLSLDDFQSKCILCTKKVCFCFSSYPLCKLRLMSDFFSAHASTAVQVALQIMALFTLAKTNFLPAVSSVTPGLFIFLEVMSISIMQRITRWS